MKHEPPTAERLAELNEKIAKSLSQWADIYQNGCSDPFWSDGCNLNLVRNHVIYYLMQIADLQEKPMQISFFEEAVQAVDPLNDPRIPPEVPNNYMAKDRVVFGEMMKASEREIRALRLDGNVVFYIKAETQEE